MSVAGDILNDRGDLMLAKGSQLSPRRIQSLQDKGFSSVVIDDPETDGIEIREVVSSAVRARATQKLASTFDFFSNIAGDLKTADLPTVTKALGSAEFRAKAARFDPLAVMMAEVQAMVQDILNAETLDGLNAIMIHDDYTFQHSVDVSIVAAMIGKKSGVPEDRIVQLTLGSMLHDVGKVFIPREIINKPGKLTDEEFARMKAHPTLGWQMLHASGAGQNLLAHHVCFQHHERQDGSGYPRGLKGTNRVGRPDWARYDPQRMHLLGEIGAV